MDHHLLARQLSRLGIGGDSPPDPTLWRKFLDTIQQTYEDADNDRYLLERSLAISSREMRELYEELKVASEKRYRVIFEGAHDAILLVDPTGRILDANHRARDLFNRSFETLLQTPIWELLLNVPDRNGSPTEPLVNGTTFPTDALASRYGEDPIPVEISMSNESLDAQQVSIYVIRDNRERKAAERALRKSEARFQAIVDDQTELINRFDLDGRINFVNVAYAELYGMEPEELIGRRHQEFLSPKNYQALQESIAQLTPGNPTKTEITSFETAEGDIRWLEWRDRLILNELGEPLEYQGVARDITEQKQAEDALRESEEQFRTLAEKSPNMIFINQGGRIIYANEASEEVMGYSLEEFSHPDFNFLKLIHEDYREQILGYFHRHQQGEEIPPYEAKLVKRDGGFLDAIHATRLIHYHGEPAILGIVTDVTERKAAEEAQVRRAAELSLINEIGSKISTVLDLEDLLDRSVSLIQRSFLFPHVGLFIAEPETGELVLEASAGQYHSLIPKQHQLHPSQGMVGWAYREGKPRRAGDVLQDDQYINLHPEEIQTRSEIALPVKIGDQIIGVLDVQSESIDAFSDHDQMVLQTLADQLGSAIENARLYEEIQRELNERKRTQSENLLQATALEAAGNAIMITDTSGEIIWINQAFTDLTGYSRSEAIGQDPGMLNSGTHPTEFFQTLWEEILNGKIWKGELVNRKKNGETYIEEQTVTPVKDEGGGITHFISIKQDVTERKKNEERIKQQAEDLQLLNSLNEKINQGENFTEIVNYLSEELRRIFGNYGTTLYLMSSERNELLAQNVNLPHQLIRRMERSLGMRMDNHRVQLNQGSFPHRVLNSQQLVVENEENAAKDILNTFAKNAVVPGREERRVLDRLFPAVIEKLPIRATMVIPLQVAQLPIGLMVITSDHAFTPSEQERMKSIAGQLTTAIHRKQVEEALRRSEANYREIFEGVQDAIFVQNMQGDILDVNERAVEMYGYAREQLLSMHVSELMPEGTGAVLPGEMVKQGLANKLLETLNIRSSGEVFPVEITSRLQRLDEEEVMLVVVRDVTSSRISQQRAQLQDRLAAVGQLAAGIAHDFNNILGTIMLYSEMMLNSGVVLPKDRERLATMFKQAQRGATLTSQILDFSRRSVMEEHELDLIAFLEDLKKLISISLPENVNVQYQFNGQDHLMVEADPTRMQQVIMNLALNSRDAMPQGGDFMLSVDSITVETGEPPYPGMAPGRWIQVKISDTGEGIPPDVLPHIFEPFFTTKPHGQGTGLGLAQVYGIIKQHDGYIDVESALGEGTAFTIYLPQIEMSTSEQDPSTDREEVFGEGETILVVEDDDATRRALCEILEDLGYRVFYAQDGSAAVKVLEAENGSIDLVISDLVMPHMGGRELYDIIQERFHQVQMILITGYPLGEQTRELLDRRKVNWIQKPLTSEELANAVRAMLDLVRFEGFGADGEG